MTTKIGINGFGRIGRSVLRVSLNNPDLEVVAINDLTDAKMLAHLLKYDTLHGKLEATVTHSDDMLHVDGIDIKVFSEHDPAQIPWSEYGVDIVVESTGRFNSHEDAVKHIQAGAKKVIISAPAKEADLDVVMGVNEHDYNDATHHIISNSSCTTNCLAPVIKVLNDQFGIRRGMMTTVHAYTNDQQILDFPHKDYRRARAAAENIIPTTTGAAKAVALVLPEMKGKLNGFAFRVPTANVSVIDLVVELNTNVTVDDVNHTLKQAAEGSLKGILAYSDEPLVSSDYNGDPASSIVDGLCTLVIEDNLIKVVAWYDNEWGYSNRIIDLAQYIAKQGV